MQVLLIQLGDIDLVVVSGVLIHRIDYSYGYEETKATELAKSKEEEEEEEDDKKKEEEEGELEGKELKNRVSMLVSFYCRSCCCYYSF